MACWDWQTGAGWQTHGVFAHSSQMGFAETTPSTSIALPAETILLSERYKLSPWEAAGRGGDANPRGIYDDNDQVFMGGYKPQVFPGQTSITGADCTWTVPCPNGPSEVANGFNGMTTFSFSDGHAKAMNPQQTIDWTAYSLTNCDSHGYKLWDKTRTQ
jgi:hypothetical protein